MKKSQLSILVACLIAVSACTSNKKLQQDDDFATEASGGQSEAGSDSLDNKDVSEFDLDDKTASTSNQASSTAAEDEFSDFDDPTVQKPTEASTTPVKDEFADFEQSPAQANTNQLTPEVPVANENISSTVVAPIPDLAGNNQTATPSTSVNVDPTPAPIDNNGTTTSPSDVISHITAVQYKSNQNGGSVLIQADAPLQYTTRLNSATNQLVVEVQNAVVPQKLKRSLNTKDMASSIGSIDIYQKNNSKVARFVVQLRSGTSEPLVQPEGNSLIIVGEANQVYLAKQKADAEKNQNSQAGHSSAQEGFVDLNSDSVMGTLSLEEFLAGNHKFYGKKISIETNNLEVKEAIKFIAEESGVNILMDDGLDGKVSLKLKQVPWDQALILILKAKKLGYIRQGNVLRIAKIADLQNEELEAYKLLESRRNNEPLIVKRFLISYAKLSEIEVKIKEFLDSTSSVSVSKPIGANGAATPQVNQISNGQNNNNNNSANRGRVIADERTGSLIVTDTPDNLIKIEKLIVALDIPPKQIFVETRLISATEKFSRNLGVDWKASGSTATANSAKLSITNGAASATSGANGTFTWGNLDLVGNLDATIALGEEQQKVTVLNTQRTIVTSGVPAKIDATDILRIPTTTTTQGSGTTTNTSGFTSISSGLNGTVLPQASNNDLITADISLVQVKVADQVTGSTTSQAIGGKVLAKSGQTVVVSANFSSQKTVTENGVPGLRDIPVLGWMFKGKGNSTNKSESMLFVTMKLLDTIQDSFKKAENSDSKSTIDLQ